MRERETLQQLIDEDTASSTLRKNATAPHAITALQTILHWLGFNQQLRWEEFGADGDYGAATTAAVAEFARRNSSTANGGRVTTVLAKRILARYDALEELKQLADDVAKQRVEKNYRVGSGDKIRIASLQTLLNELGYGAQLKWVKWGADGDYGKATRKAVTAFSADEGLAGDGTLLTLLLAQPDCWTRTRR